MVQISMFQNNLFIAEQAHSVNHQLYYPVMQCRRPNLPSESCIGNHLRPTFAVHCSDRLLIPYSSQYYQLYSIFTVRNSSCRKVRFPQASVILSSRHPSLQADTPLGRHPEEFNENIFSLSLEQRYLKNMVEYAHQLDLNFISQSCVSLIFMYFIIQGSHSTWKNEGTPGKPGNIMEFCKI